MNQSDMLFDKVLGCLAGGVIGDAMGTPTEKLSYEEIDARFGWVTSFQGAGTDDSALKHILCETIFRAHGHPTADMWGEDWLRNADTFIGSTLFFAPVVSTFWKLRGERALPREAGNGNMASSSSAMCISPMGIINAGNPRQAALETFEVASLIHHNSSRDGACAIAAAVAEAFRPQADVDSVLEAAARYLPERSAQAMREALAATLALARSCGDYLEFRKRFHEQLPPTMHFTDSRETVPVALALVLLAKGDAEQAVIYGANFGRDADTIASMAGAVAGALRGASAFPTQWMDGLGPQADKQRELAARITEVTLARAHASLAAARALIGMAGAATDASPGSGA
jgi:ADP-ribosylglycohydrolase